MDIRYINNDKLLEDFETKIRCNHYCPVACNHETEFNLGEMRKEIVRRMKE